jgi:hypothetical protein
VALSPLVSGSQNLDYSEQLKLPTEKRYRRHLGEITEMFRAIAFAENDCDSYRSGFIQISAKTHPVGSDRSPNPDASTDNMDEKYG